LRSASRAQIQRMSDVEGGRVPQHDPPADGGLVQPEVDERDDTILVEGDDADHVLPPSELEPYTPDVSIASGMQRTALWLAILVAVVVVVIVVVIAATR
jgi:hypothetical protein